MVPEIQQPAPEISPFRTPHPQKGAMGSHPPFAPNWFTRRMDYGTRETQIMVTNFLKIARNIWEIF
ncbi:MAG: hypothetical protein CM15mP9_3870 [Methanobacteriota archaeon]|nr:MAG: hypothetical protein CM15mP9_3870 [Euryarchaeota archaeon]